MAEIKRKNRKWIGYTIYGIVLTLVLLYYRFPEDIFGDFIENAMREMNPDIVFSSENISPSFPPGLLLKNARVSERKAPDKALFLVEKISVRPGMLSLLKMDPEFILNCSANDGNITGLIKIDNENSEREFQTTLNFENIIINNDSVLPEIIKKNVQGTLTGSVSFSAKSPTKETAALDTKNLITAGSGEASLTMTNGSLVITPPILRLNSVSFDILNLKMGLENQKITVSQIDLKGKSLTGESSGSINLSTDFLESRVDLKGSIVPFADLFKGIPDSEDAARFFQKRLKNGRLSFRVIGTINEPRIQLI